jgi:sigma-E factor negative regulatory protein RseA
MDKMDNQELISALADGQVQGENLARAVQVAAGGDGLRTWHAYHVVGEVLRSGDAPAAGAGPEAFLARLQQRLAQEPAPAARPAAQPQPIRVQDAAPAANDWRWKLVAGVASVAAVAAVGWNLWGVTAGGTAAPQLAAAPGGVLPASADARASKMIRDARLDQFMAAHRQYGGAGALQSSSGFLRNATFEGPAR